MSLPTSGRDAPSRDGSILKQPRPSVREPGRQGRDMRGSLRDGDGCVRAAAGGKTARFAQPSDGEVFETPTSQDNFCPAARRGRIAAQE